MIDISNKCSKPCKGTRQTMQSYWFVFIVTLCISAFIKSLFYLFSFASSKKEQAPLPPGPPFIPVIGGLLWIRKSFSQIEHIIRDMKTRYGPIVSLRITSRPSIFVGSHSLAHRALVQNGAVFSDRPKALPTARVFNSDQHSISSAAYGPIWRLLRRNLTSDILHPSRVKLYSRVHRWVLGILIQRLQIHDGALLVDHFLFAMFSLLLLMCFGDKVKENQIQPIESVLRKTLESNSGFNILNIFPKLGKIFFRKRWRELMQLRLEQENLLLPLIRARIEAKRGRSEGRAEADQVVAYVDTLLDLQWPDEKRAPNEEELVTLCTEFLNAGTDTTTTALQWIMANLVKYPAVQDKLYQDIVAVVGPPPPISKEMEMVEREDDLQKMPYLKAVVLEALRRHPPSHFVLPHSVKEDVLLDGYLIPKNALVNFTVADMGWDPEVWENPMEFRPERFLGRTMTRDGERSGSESQMFDLTGSKEIKMMPFGAGRRICPGIGLALLHLEYFVANLIWFFEWKRVDGDDVDLTEKQAFTVVMKNPLRALISPRVQST